MPTPTPEDIKAAQEILPKLIYARGEDSKIQKALQIALSALDLASDFLKAEEVFPKFDDIKYIKCDCETMEQHNKLLLDDVAKCLVKKCDGIIEALDKEDIYHSDDGKAGYNGDPEKLALGEILSGENIKRIEAVLKAHIFGGSNG